MNSATYRQIERKFSGKKILYEETVIHPTDLTGLHFSKEDYREFVIMHYTRDIADRTKVEIAEASEEDLNMGLGLYLKNMYFNTVFFPKNISFKSINEETTLIIRQLKEEFTEGENSGGRKIVSYLIIFPYDILF